MKTVSRRRNATLLLMSLLSAMFALTALLANPHGAAAAAGLLGGPKTTSTLALSPTNQTTIVVPGQIYRYEYVIANASAQPQQVQFTAKNEAGWGIAGDNQQILVPAFSKVPVKIAVKVPTSFTTALGANLATLTVTSLTATRSDSATSYLTLQWGK